MATAVTASRVSQSTTRFAMTVSYTDELEQAQDGRAAVQELERPSLAVGGPQVVDAQGIIYGPGDVLRCDGAVGGEGGHAVGGAVGLPAADAAAGEQHGHAVG